MRRTIVLSMLLLVAMAGYCQEEGLVSPKFGKHKFGISLGYERSFLEANLSDWDVLGISDDINSVNTVPQSGFSLGILYQYDFTPQFTLRTQPLLMFEENGLEYDLATISPNTNVLIRPVSVSTPIHAVFTYKKSDRTKKISPSVFFGGQYILDIAREEDSELSLDLHSFALDAGVGLYKGFEHFDFRLELMYSLGTTDLLQARNNIYHNALESVFKDVFSVRLIFFG